MLWGGPVLALILALAAWKALHHNEPVLWPPSAGSAEAVVASPEGPPTQLVAKPGQSTLPVLESAQSVVLPSSNADPTARTTQHSPSATEATPNALKTALDQWSTAWRAQDAPAYLGMYADDFETPKGMSRRAWAQMRAARISSKQKIRLQIRDLQIDQQGLSATVKFTQIYADERTESFARKTMQWVFRDGRWLIKREATD